MKQKILHFNNYNHTALTIASQEIPNQPNWYVLGMSLAHKNDNGSKAIGRNNALEMLKEGLNDTMLFEHIYNMSAPVFGQKGHYIVHSLKIVKEIVKELRLIERYCANSKKNSVFHLAFFDLFKFWRNIS
jgi:hypothetical protein